MTFKGGAYGLAGWTRMGGDAGRFFGNPQADVADLAGQVLNRQVRGGVDDDGCSSLFRTVRAEVTGAAPWAMALGDQFPASGLPHGLSRAPGAGEGRSRPEPLTSYGGHVGEASVALVTFGHVVREFLAAERVRGRLTQAAFGRLKGRPA
jgi:hypothetical protein